MDWMGSGAQLCQQGALLASEVRSFLPLSFGVPLGSILGRRAPLAGLPEEISMSMFRSTVNGNE